MQIIRYTQKDFRKKLIKKVSIDSADEHSEKVRKIIHDIRSKGDKAVAEYTLKFDNAKIRPSAFRVTEEELVSAERSLDGRKRDAIKEAIGCVRHFHQQTLPQNWVGQNPHGATVGERFYPIQRVGLYIPGGQVPLVSTVIMTSIPAILAGCPQIAVCTPPNSAGEINTNLLAALHLCGVREVYRIGGVQAIAAMALGTETVPAVDKIAGPGNAYVIEAKRQLFGTVGIDLLPGPSEVMVIADKSAHPEYIAAELLAQAEHGTGKEHVYFATTEESLIAAVKTELARQLSGLNHAQAMTHVLQKNCLFIVVENLEQLVEVTNWVAPEHLQLMLDVDVREQVASKITTAGAMLFGHHTPTVLGDFTAGPSHTLPTGGTGRFCSGLQTVDFMRRTSIVEYTPQALVKAESVVSAFSEMENLDAHGASLMQRLKITQRARIK